MKETKDVILSSTFDARIWVEEWLKTIKEKPNIPTDKGCMLGWFANAIMAGYDHAYQEMEAKVELARDDCQENPSSTEEKPNEIISSSGPVGINT